MTNCSIKTKLTVPVVLLDKAETLKSTSQQVSVASQGHLSFSCDPIHPLLRHVDSIVTKQMNEYALDVRKARPCAAAAN